MELIACKVLLALRVDGVAQWMIRALATLIVVGLVVVLIVIQTLPWLSVAVRQAETSEPRTLQSRGHRLRDLCRQRQHQL